MRRGRGRFPRWFRRRTPLALLAALPVVVVGGAAIGQGSPGYVGTATFVVPSGATSTGPGASYEARSLALTYARLIPEDRSLLRVLARSVGTDAERIASSLAATPVVDTALVRVSFESSDLTKTEKVIAAAVGALTGAQSPTSAIPPGTLVLTGTSVEANSGSGTGASRGLVGVAALALAAAVVVLAERTDPRVDDANDLPVAPGAAVLDLTRLSAGVARRALWTRAAREGVRQVVLVGAGDQHGDAVEWCDERLRPDPGSATLTHPSEAGDARLLELPRVPHSDDPALGQVTDHDVALVVRAGTQRARVDQAIATLQAAEARVQWMVFAPARLRRHAETGATTTLPVQGDPRRSADGSAARGSVG